jgi:hypothetical protein
MIIAEIILIAGTLATLGLAGYSIIGTHEAAKRTCNGELKQLAHLDRTIAKFHKHARFVVEADGRMSRKT